MLATLVFGCPVLHKRPEVDQRRCFEKSSIDRWRCCGFYARLFQNPVRPFSSSGTKWVHAPGSRETSRVVLGPVGTEEPLRRRRCAVFLRRSVDECAFYDAPFFASKQTLATTEEHGDSHKTEEATAVVLFYCGCVCLTLLHSVKLTLKKRSKTLGQTKRSACIRAQGPVNNTLNDYQQGLQLAVKCVIMMQSSPETTEYAQNQANEQIRCQRQKLSLS